MNAPATAKDLDHLASAVEPWPLPPSLVTFLKLADGMAWNARELWPSMDCGRLLTAREMADEYRRNLTTQEPWQWSKRWLPISRFSWAVAAIELVDDRPAAILDASMPDPPRLAAPCLAGLLNAAVALAEAGALDNPPGPDDVQEYHARALERRRLLTAIYARQGWQHAPVPPERDIDPDEWPDYWFPPPDAHLYATRPSTR